MTLSKDFEGAFPETQDGHATLFLFACLNGLQIDVPMEALAPIAANTRLLYGLQIGTVGLLNGVRFELDKRCDEAIESIHTELSRQAE